MPSTRKVADCRRFPSEKGCTLTIARSEEEVMDVALYHAVKSHGHEDTPELREQLKAFVQDE
jgi:predicted small metal-binding protein